MRTSAPVTQWRGCLSSIAAQAWADASPTVCGGSLYIIGASTKEPFGAFETTVMDTVRGNDIQSCCEQCATTTGCRAFLFSAQMCQLMEVHGAQPVVAAPDDHEVRAREAQDASGVTVEAPPPDDDGDDDAPASPLPAVAEKSVVATVPAAEEEENEAGLPHEDDASATAATTTTTTAAAALAATAAMAADEAPLEVLAVVDEPLADLLPPPAALDEPVAAAAASTDDDDDAPIALTTSLPAAAATDDADADENALAGELLGEEAAAVATTRPAPRKGGKATPAPTKDLLDALDLSDLDLGDLVAPGGNGGGTVNNAAGAAAAAAVVVAKPKDLLSLVDAVAEEMVNDIVADEANLRAVREEDDALRREEEAEDDALVVDVPPPQADEMAVPDVVDLDSGGVDDLPAPANDDDDGGDDGGGGDEHTIKEDPPPKRKSLVDMVMSGEAPLADARSAAGSAGGALRGSVDDLLASSSAEAEDDGDVLFDPRPAPVQNSALVADKQLSQAKTGGASSSSSSSSALAPLVRVTKAGETLMAQAECAKLAATPISSVLAPGMYNLVIADPFYKAKQKFFGRFRAVSEVHSFISDWQAQYPTPVKGRPWQVDTFTVGRSAEDRPIRAFEFGNARRGRHVFIVAGLRGCDWIGPLAAVHSAVALVGRRRSTQALLDAVRFHVIPLVNVDGYHYSRRKSPTTARHWCDNRRISAGGHGTNLERNWGTDGVNWGFGKKGKDSRKDKLGFQGIVPFSEPEVKAVRDYIQHYVTGAGRAAVVHVRCCVGQVSAAMGERKADKDSNEGAATLAAAMRAAGEGTDYAVVKRPEAFSADNTGQLVDWAYALGADHSYVVELRATNVATHVDRYQITPEPFNALSKELEVSLVAVAQLLLAQEVQGTTPTDFKPKLAASSSSSSSSSSSKSSAKSSSSSSTSKKTASKAHH